MKMDFGRSFYSNEYLYLAGPLVFYPRGREQLLAMRRRAEALGFRVSLPNDNVLKLDHEDIRKNADSIFENCAGSINASTAILSDLECFRGTEPDGGTVFEIGMVYARGLRCYAYSRDMRDAVQKYQGSVLKDGKVFDRDGRLLPYHDLPYSPCVVGSSKLVEGDLDDCLRVLMQDIDQERKFAAKRQTPGQDLSASITVSKSEKPLIYLAGQERYDDYAPAIYERVKELCRQYGFAPTGPMDEAPGVPGLESEDPLAMAYHHFDRWQQHVRNCDILVADLNDFHGWEPNSDVAFEAGMAWQLGKKCIGFMRSTAPMICRIPHYGEEAEYRDQYGNDVENFNYPINLMFASSMPIVEGGWEQAIAQAAKAYQR